MSHDDYSMGDMYRGMDARRKLLRARFGVECPTCKINRPKTNATILLPQQRCRVDGYCDPRPNLTQQQEQDVYRPVRST